MVRLIAMGQHHTPIKLRKQINPKTKKSFAYYGVKKRDKGILTLSLFFYINLFSGKELISYYYL
ncbi:hypothetical protein [Bacillus thuringiensis]|uniref:hypothetical protein n=1 Tax=Bacillus thuringiensis TaxID=1428 RepID=UPI000BF44F2C|nr:hypothetical protein [Bacillus thuringiensis]PFD59768.1 hypothetical protein CN274_08880 [Bacillus thuringiensis]